MSSSAVVLKALQLLGKRAADGSAFVLRDSKSPAIWWVTSSSGTKQRYRVQTDWDPETRTLTWISCSCPHGASKGGGQCRCYHAAAVLMLLRDEKLAAEHEPVETASGLVRCVCGWPTEEDFRMHTPEWQPRFSEHLLDERRKLL